MLLFPSLMQLQACTLEKTKETKIFTKRSWFSCNKKLETLRLKKIYSASVTTVIYYMHCITYVLEKWTTVVVSMHNVRRSRFTLSRVCESCLACQHFISIYFVNLLTIFCFSIRMPIDTCSNIYLENSQKLFSFLREDKPSLSSLVSHLSQLPHSRHVLHFRSSTKLPRNARENIRWKTGTFQKFNI